MWGNGNCRHRHGGGSSERGPLGSAAAPACPGGMGPASAATGLGSAAPDVGPASAAALGPAPAALYPIPSLLRIRLAER
jgi:hypothetical protein